MSHTFRLQSRTELVSCLKFPVLSMAKQIFLARCCARHVKILHSQNSKAYFVCLQTVFGLWIFVCKIQGSSEMGKMQCNYCTFIIGKREIFLLRFVWWCRQKVLVYTIKKAASNSCECSCLSFFVLLHLEFCRVFRLSSIFGPNSFTFCLANGTSLCGALESE